MKCEKCGGEFYLLKTCPKCGADTDEQKKDSESLIPTATYPMKWYNFLKISLWFGIIINVSQGFMRLVGRSYEGMSDAVYAAVPSLRVLDIFYGIALFGLAVLGYMAWSGLNGYGKKDLSSF